MFYRSNISLKDLSDYHKDLNQNQDFWGYTNYEYKTLFEYTPEELDDKIIYTLEYPGANKTNTKVFIKGKEILLECSFNPYKTKDTTRTLTITPGIDLYPENIKVQFVDGIVTVEVLKPKSHNKKDKIEVKI